MVCHHMQTCALLRCDDAAPVLDRCCKRLLYQYMAAALERGYSLVGVKVIGAGDDHYVRARLLQQTFVILAGLGLGVFCTCFFQLSWEWIEESDDLAASVFFGNLGAVQTGTARAANQQRVFFLHHFSTAPKSSFCSSVPFSRNSLATGPSNGSRDFIQAF